jgi:hypothetical protein
MELEVSMNQSKYANWMAQQRELLAPMTYIAEWWEPSQNDSVSFEEAGHSEGTFAAGEHFRAWGLASMLAFSAGCAGSTVTRPDTRTPWSASTEVMSLEWPPDEGENDGEVQQVLFQSDENLPEVLYNASSSTEQADNQAHSAALRQTTNGSAPDDRGSAVQGEQGDDSHSPRSPAAKSGLTDEEKDVLYRHDIYGGSRCAAGLAMGFSAPVCF